MNTLFLDEKYLQKYTTIVGMDEAGRGPWAGPVVMAGIQLNINDRIIIGVNDSKLLNSQRRADLYQRIINQHIFKIESISSEIIDSIGIMNALVKGFNKIITSLNAQRYLLDGYFKKEYFPLTTECIVKGDRNIYAIAAASILAKHTRDSQMLEFHELYPNYNFKDHKGYGTADHLKNIERYGICPIHRKSYKPITSFISL